MTDLLKNLFDSIQTADEVDQLVAEQREEDLHLKFKQKTNRSNGAPDDIDRKNFSRRSQTSQMPTAESWYGVWPPITRTMWTGHQISSPSLILKDFERGWRLGA